MMFADRHLARRIEAMEITALKLTGDTMRRLDAASEAEWLDINGAAALHAGADSLLTRSRGLGLQGEVSAEEVEAFEEFHRERGSKFAPYVSPLADASAIAILGERGYAPEHFVNMLALPMNAFEAPKPRVADMRVERVGEDRAEEWADLVGRAFNDGQKPQPNFAAIMTTYAHYPGAGRFMAWIRDEPVGGGLILMHEGVASIQTGAVLPEFRSRGAQTALLVARLSYAAEQGCELVVARTTPGANSQRNVERMGFRVVYTEAKMKMIKA